MATIINNPGENRVDGSSSSYGVIIGAIIVVLVLLGVLFFTLPYFREKIDDVTESADREINPTINVQLPNTPDSTVPETQ